MAPAKRTPTPTERLHEVTMAFATRPHVQPESSIDLSRNARGVVQIGVTVRGDDAGTAAAEAMTLFDMLNNRYPYPVTNGGE